jgi:hypothetical protein
MEPLLSMIHMRLAKDFLASLSDMASPAQKRKNVKSEFCIDCWLGAFSGRFRTQLLSFTYLLYIPVPTVVEFVDRGSAPLFWEE